MDCDTSSLVWAKLRYCVYWPAILISKPPPELGKPPRGKVCVFFFGTKNFGFPELENVCSYFEHRDKYTKKGRGDDFKLAVKHCNEFLSDPQKFAVHTQLDPTISKIVVKQESPFNVTDSNEGNIDDLTSGNVCRECEQFKEKYSAICEQNAALKLKLNELQETVSKLTQGKENDVYEVEKILSHLLKGTKNKKEMHYLIRWKNYDQTHDSWVPEKNLKCAAILKKYKQKNDMN